MNGPSKASREGSSQRQLRVLYVAHTMVRGGSASSLYLLLANMPRGVVDAHLAAPPGPARKDFEQLGVRVHSIPGVATLDSVAGAPLQGRRLLTLLRALWNARHSGVLRRLLTELQPDVVHLNERGMLQAAIVAGRGGWPVVMHARSVSDRQVAWICRLSAVVYARYVDRLIAIDESVRQSLREVPHCAVVYNPLRAPARVQIRPPQGRVRFTFLSGLLPVKGIWDLLHAIEHLRDRGDFLVQIAGENPRPRKYYHSVAGRVARALGLTPDLEKDIRSWVADRALDERVIILGQVEPNELLAETDVLVFPSRLNGPGRSVFEAGALGIPSIVSLKDRVEDVVSHGTTGLIVPEGDPVALADAMRALVDDPALRISLGENARQRCLELFDPATSAARVLGIYRDIVSRLQV